jgi:hydroxymethylglutaryl-CoA lyase
MLGAIRERAPGVPIRCHFHNTRNTGLANAQAAIEAGTTSLDASIGGIGGCPFAPAATGNIPTDDLLYMLDRSGIATGVSLEQIVETSKWLQEQLGRSTPAMLPKAGIFPKVAEVYRAAS